MYVPGSIKTKSVFRQHLSSRYLLSLSFRNSFFFFFFFSTYSPTGSIPLPLAYCKLTLNAHSSACPYNTYYTLLPAARQANRLRCAQVRRSADILLYIALIVSFSSSASSASSSYCCPKPHFPIRTQLHSLIHSLTHSLTIRSRNISHVSIMRRLPRQQRHT